MKPQDPCALILAVTEIPGSAPTATHSHRWRIEEQTGPRSPGSCECGVERFFQNGWEADQGGRLGGGGWTAQRPRTIRIAR